MKPSRRLATVSGVLAAVVSGAIVQWPLDAGPILAGSVALYAGTAVGFALWALPRTRWSNADDVHADAFQMVLLAGASVVPVVAMLVPVFALGGVSWGVRAAMGALAFCFGLTCFAGHSLLLVVNHRRYGGHIEFQGAAEDHGDEPVAD